MKQINLFEELDSPKILPANFRIIEIGSLDARSVSDHYNTLKELIFANEDMYPNIQNWFITKVTPGLLSDQRIGYVGYIGDKPIASAILKIGKRSKFCHLRIHEAFQDIDLGQLFFTQMTFEIRNKADEVHFTLPESLWEKKKAFFESFGFNNAIKAWRQYRHGETELICTAPIKRVWSASLQRLPKLISKFTVGGYSFENKLLLSIQPKIVEKILSGIKTVEIRRRFSTKWIGCRIVLYASKPQAALIGEATIKSIQQDHPKNIWALFGNRIGCSWDEFERYSANANQIFAIELCSILPYLFPVPLHQVEQILGENLRPPQSFCELNFNNTGTWAQAVSIASLLHGRSKLINKNIAFSKK